MPLNVNDPSLKPVPSGPPPLMQDPGEGRSRRTIIIVVVVGLAALIFVLFQFGFFDSGSGESAAPPVETETVTPPAPPPVIAETPPAPPAPTGRYSIIISSFSALSDAQELAASWTQAGYTSFVSSSPRWHRVAVGRFETIADAQAEAEKLRQALEYGYWITDTSE